MLTSVNSLLNAPYNKGSRVFFAFYRFFIWKFIRAFKIKGFTYKVWNDRKVLLDYRTFQSMSLMYNYWVDWEEYNLIDHAVRPEDTVLDVGSNQGLYTLRLSRYTTRGAVHSFEPDPGNFSYLKKHVELNDLSAKVHINNMGVADRSGFLSFTQGLDGQNHLVTGSAPGTIEIPVITLDEYCRKESISHVRYLKIDIEGFELAAFKGAGDLLRNGRIDIIQMEVNEALEHSGTTVEELISFLLSCGYHLAGYDVKNNRLAAITYSPEIENYFAVRDIATLNEQLQLAKTGKKKSGI